MQYYRCKCGKKTMWSSGIFPQDCEGCDECGTTYAQHPDFHKPLEPHDYSQIRYNSLTGKPYKECSKCHQHDPVSFAEAQSNETAIDTVVYFPPEDDRITEKPIEKEEIKIPANLDEAMEMLSTPANIEYIKGKKTEFHFFTGMSLRNRWGLWSGSSPLKTWFNERGIYHADDMSQIIIDSFERKVKGKPIDLERQIEFYRKFWEKRDPKVNTGEYEKEND